jgi:hypothetical protein
MQNLVDITASSWFIKVLYVTKGTKNVIKENWKKLMEKGFSRGI